MLHILIFFYLCHLVDTDGVKTVSVREGESITLHTEIINLPEYSVEYIQWVFGPEDTRITVLDVQTGDITYYKNDIFGDRVQMDNETASLTISHTRITDSGLYNMYGSLINESFNVTVYSHLPNPVITRDSTCSSSLSIGSKCVLLCSVANVSDVSLSWYKGNSLLSSISVSDLISSVSLHLEVENQDNDTYSCVLDDCFTNRTEHLDISNLCLKHPGCVHCCGFTEAVVRLVISAVVGVAAVAIVVYDITSRRAET